MDNLTRPHLILSKQPESLDFTSRSSFVPKTSFPHRDRQIHGEWLQNQFETIWNSSKSRSEFRRAASIPSRNGVYIEFSGKADFPLHVNLFDSTVVI